MDVRSLVLFAALAITSAGFAGCIEAPSFLSTDDESTAIESRKAADEAAAAWSPDAELSSVMTIELTNSTDPRVPVDPEVGNGRAVAWWYVYCLETENGMDVRAFRVQDGTATEEKDAAALGAAASDFDDMDMQAIEGWEIDSDKAVEIAKTDERFRLAAQGFNATVVQGLARHGDMAEYASADYAAGGADSGEQTETSEMKAYATFWWIVAGSVDGIVVALVDAEHGNLIEVRDLDFSFSMPEIDFASASVDEFVPEPIHLEGADEMGDEPAEFPFEVTYPMSGTMDFMADGGDPLRGLSWEIVDEDGEWVAGPRGSFFGGGSRDGYDVELEEASYTLVIYERSWVPLPVPGQPMSYEFTLHLDPSGHESHDEE